MTPSAPRLTWAALNASGSFSAEHSRTLPSASTSVRPTTWLEILRSFSPVPWVAVEIAPLIVW